MSRFLHRPMFRRGGSTGEGITSGLTRLGYKRGRVVEPGGYDGDEDDRDPYQLLKGYPKFRKAYEEQVGPRAKSSSGADFWLNFGTNILAQPGGRPILQTLGTAAKEPLSKFQEQRAFEDISKREEERDLIKSYVASRAEALGESDQSQFSKEQQSAAIADYTDELFKLTDDLAAGTITKKEHDKKRQKIFNQLGPYMKDNQALEKLWAVPDYADEAYRQIKTAILADESPYLDAKGQQVIEDGEVVTVADWFSEPEHLAELRRKATHMYLKEAQELEVGAITGWEGKKGGRAGYQNAGAVGEGQNVLQGEGAAVQEETIEEGTTPDQLSFQELRSRLPVEITDDIIRLMANSPEALTDFAQIQTQQDVDNFNSKYGVNLVLPSEA